MTEELFYRLMAEFNGWWKTGSVNKELCPETKRKVFGRILEYVGKPQIIAIEGPRRVGKSTLIFQIIEHLLKTGVSPKEILYFSWDESITSNEQSGLDRLLEIYRERIAEDGKNPEYIFIDEIQYLDLWQVHIKRFYDLNKGTKIFITGSGGVEISQKTKESLAGRVYKFELLPLSFNEYLEFKKVQNPGMKSEEPVLMYEKLKKNLPDFRVIEKHFEEYIRRGGFPEVTEEPSKNVIYKYLSESVIDREIYKDIPQAFHLREVQLLKHLFNYACENTAQLFEISNLAKNLKASREVVGNYISFLEQSRLICVVENYAKSDINRARKSKKILVADPGLAVSVLKYYDDLFINKDYLGHLVETTVLLHAFRKFEAVNFYRDSTKREVDIITRTGKSVLPIEVGFTEEIHSIANLEYFMSKNNLLTGMLLSKKQMELRKIGNKKIVILPVSIYLGMGDIY
ncbi:MAG: hypothetical protein A2536_02985 [Candidatus Firestonebacteria bacterium RIFOXYD2_FULL_39_29]|nr:MAG: hypothetical protein A2536_02985 [Candidatus Firestonebacteria bacterium RIFOXYD2_FULL_39_29]